MFRKLQAIICVLCIFSFAEAETLAIATITAHGDILIDGHQVKGNATLFNGSTVQTSRASADLRVGTGTNITLATNSSGTLFGDHMLLKSGQTILAGSGTFEMRANGFHVTLAGPNSRGIVAIKSETTVEVAAVSGTLGAANSSGIALATVRPGASMSFAFQAASGSNAFSAVGKFSFENGHYFLTVDKTGSKFEITGEDLSRLVGKRVKVNGTVVGGAGVGGVDGVVAVSSAHILVAGTLTTSELIVAGVLIGSATGTAVGIYKSNQSSTPASR